SGLFTTAPTPRRGRDLRAHLRLRFEEAVRGTTTEVRQDHRTIKVRIPAGVEDGQTIRVPGKGGPGRDGGAAGDLLVSVRVGSHRLFGRQGMDLTLTVPITFAEAALGAEITVPTFEGD